MKLRIQMTALISVLLLSLPLPAFAAKRHVVKAKDTLSGLSRKYGVSVEEIKNANKLKSSKIVAGKTILIPVNEPQPANQQTKNCGTYIVESGDTLYSISRRTGLRVADLRRINGLAGNTIRTGQTLSLGSASFCTIPVVSGSAAQNKGFKLVNSDILQADEFRTTLEELTDIDTSKSVDLVQKFEERNRFAELKQSAYGFLGARYRFGGNSRNALDCSSFTQQVFREQKITLPRTAREQFRIGNEVAQGDLRKGDLVFFRTYASFPSHVGIYLGNRKMIHASSRSKQVVVSSMDTPYYLSRYIGARRIEKINPDTIDLQSLILEIDEEMDSDAQNNDHMAVDAVEAQVR